MSRLNFQKWRWFLIVMICCCLFGATSSGFQFQLISLSGRAIENNKNYTYIYFENGYPTKLTGRRPQSAANLAARANPDLVIQTGYYSLKFDCDDMTLQGYDAVAGSDYLTALHQDASVFSPATLSLTVYKAGTSYTCTSALIQDLTNDYVRLVQSGQFVQRFDHLGLAFSAEDGTPLDGTGRFEVTAWPDRVVFKLDLTGISGVTQTEVRVISPLSADHQAVAATNYVHLALRPQDDLLQTVLVSSNIITEAYDLKTLAALACRFDEDECALHIDVPADKVIYPAATNRVDEYIIAVTNPAGLPANIPLVFDQPIPRAITGTMMTLCDENDGSPIGIPVQISKNWHADTNAPTIHQGTWLRGYTMVALGAGETKRFRLRVIYGYWGGAGAASHSQLCLIGYGGNWTWDESALGTWGESMTYDLTQGTSFIADVRPSFTTSMKGGTYGWTENIGGGDFLVYYDSTNKFHWAKKLKTAYHWTGPNMTEVLYSGITDDEKIRFTYTTRLVRTSDYQRRFHAYQYEFLKDVTSPARLVFYQMAADYYIRPMFTNYYRGDETGLLASYICDPGGNVYKGSPIPFEDQWLAVDDIFSIAGPIAAKSRRGILSLSSTLNGNSFPLYLHTYGRSYGTNTILFDVSSDSVSRSYSAGNVVKGELEFILPPKAATNYWGSDTEFSTRLNSYGTNAWQAVADEFKYNTRLSVTMHQGTLLRNYPVEIQASTASGDVLADFTVNSGGIGHVPVILKGVYGALQAQRYLNGAWVALESVEISQNNYYQGYRDVTGAMDCVFNFTRPSTNLNSSWRMRILKN